MMTRRKSYQSINSQEETQEIGTKYPCAIETPSSEEGFNCSTPPSPCSLERVLVLVLFIGAFIVTCVIMIKYLHVEPDSVCYPRLGCFILTGGWSERPSIFNFFPKSPSAINTTLFVTTRNDPFGTRGSLILPKESLEKLRKFHWGKAETLFFIIHGYTDDSTTWMQDLKQALLNLEDVTVIIVDWRSGASGYYPQVVANTRVVAREISVFIRHLSKSSHLASKRINIIGHSLGAQIASYVGKAFQEPRIHQVTALDPAFPLFEGYSTDIRLDWQDATHVLVIHSNIGPWGLGMKEAVGSVDLYLNNGRDQRGCIQMTKALKEPLREETKTFSLGLDTITNMVTDLLACSHRRAYQVLEDILISLRNNSRDNKFVAYPMQLKDKKQPMDNTIHHSFCGKAEKTRQNFNCWNFRFDKRNAFFQLPENSTLSTFFMPTTEKSPFCVRLGLLEVKVILPRQSSSLFLNALISNYNITISYDAFGEDVRIYQGKVNGLSVIQAWVELPCQALFPEVNKTLNFTISFTSISTKKTETSSHVDNKASPISRMYCHHVILRYYDFRREKISSVWMEPRKLLIEIPINTCFQMTSGGSRRR